MHFYRYTKRFIRSFLLSLTISSLTATTVMAAPTVTELQNEKASIETETSDLQTQLNDLVAKNNALQNDLIDTGEKLIQTQKDLEKAEQLEAQQYDDMKMRIRYLYENGGSNFVLEQIVTSGSIGEILNQIEYANSMYKYDRDMLQTYQKTVDDVKKLKTDLEAKQASLKELEVQYTNESEELRTLIAENQNAVSNLDSMIRDAVAKALAEQQATAQAIAAQEIPRSSMRPESTAAGTTAPTETAPTEGTVPQAPTETEVIEPAAPEQVVEQPVQEPAPAGSGVVDRAYACIGLPYVWGATGPESFDCSGLVGYCLTGGYGRIGTTYTFMNWTQVSDPQPGDICTSWEHCGIYIGNGQMIHAPQPGEYVKIGPVMSGMIYVRY